MKNLKKELKIQYGKAFSYISESKKFIYLAILFFFLFSFFGFFIPLPAEVSQQILGYFQELVLKTQDYGPLEMISFLFFNNTLATFIGLFSGAFFGIITFFNLIVNGFVLGFASNYSVAQNGFLSLFRLLPHGIFELPAIFLSLGLGLKLGSFFLDSYWKKSFVKYFNNSIRVYFLIVIPLLIIAAIIEGLLIVFLS
jgi:stage II sporulation protein M